MKEEKVNFSGIEDIVYLDLAKLPIPSGRDERKLKRFERKLERMKKTFNRLQNRNPTLKQSSGLLMLLSYKKDNGMQNIGFKIGKGSHIYSMLKAFAMENPEQCILMQTAAVTSDHEREFVDAIFYEKEKGNPIPEAEAQPKPQPESQPAPVKDQAQQPADAAAETEVKPE